MTDDRFDELMRDARETYRPVPEPPLDEMWKEIEVATRGHETRDTGHGTRRFRVVFSRIAGLAATLIVGVGIGRASISMGVAHPDAAPVATTVAAAHPDSSLALPYEVETSKYLGQTAALLIALPSEMKAGRADQRFLGRAGDLLTTTRLLLDSPASSDPAMRNLLEDLELVLAQVVHLQNNQSRTELDLIKRALEQRDVLPRLRTAVADISAD